MSNTTSEHGQPKTQNPKHPLADLENPDRHQQPLLHCSLRCCCVSLFWVVLLLIIPATAYTLMSHPKPPSFSVSSLNFTQLHLTTAAQFAAKLNLTVTITNPNDEITLYYDPIHVSVVAHHGKHKIIIGRGSFPPFLQSGSDTTSLFALIENIDSDYIDEKSLEILKLDLGKNNKNNKGLDLKVEMATAIHKRRVEKSGERIKRSFKLVLRASCFGINLNYNIDDDDSTLKTSLDAAKCKVCLTFNPFDWAIPIFSNTKT